MDRIKRISYEVLDKHKSKFGEDFADNKKSLDEVAIVRSKSLKNKVAGYITKFIKKEIREEKSKQAKIASSQFEEPMEKEIQVDTPESINTKETITETVTETTSIDEKTEAVDEKTEAVDEKTEAVDEKTE